MSSPIGVPGPTRVKRSLSARESMCGDSSAKRGFLREGNRVLFAERKIITMLAAVSTGCRLLAVVLGTSAVAMFSGTASAQAPGVIRVIALPIDSGAQPFIAQAKGFFKKAGVDVTITPSTSNGAAVAAAVASGTADVGQSNIVSIAAAREQGLPFVIIAGSKLSVAALHQNALVVAAGSPIRTARDLNGKTIAVPGLKAIAAVGTGAWIDRNGGDSSTVKLLETPFSAMAAAVAAGRVDAADIPQPQLDDALKDKKLRVLADPYEAIAPQFLVGCWFTTASWAKAHPDLLRAFTSAMREAADWANRNPAETARIVGQLTHGPVSLSALPRYATTLDPKQMQPLLDAAARYGVLKSSLPAAELLAGIN